MYKNKHDFTITLEGGVIFGSEVKENNLFEAINGDNGVLVSQNGEIPIIRLFERGGILDINFGKYFKFKSTENESGILLSIGLGYIYHKIFIETIVTELPQLNNELLKGYDRLSGGVSIKQFIGTSSKGRETYVTSEAKHLLINACTSFTPYDMKKN